MHTSLLSALKAIEGKFHKVKKRRISDSSKVGIAENQITLNDSKMEYQQQMPCLTSEATSKHI